LLFEALELGPDSATQKDSAKLVAAVLGSLEANAVPGAGEFRRIAGILLKTQQQTTEKASSEDRRSLDGQLRKGSQKHKFKAFATRLAASADRPSESRRGTFPYMGMEAAKFQSSTTAMSLSSPLFARSEPALSPPQGFLKPQPSKQSRKSATNSSISTSHLASLANLGVRNMSLSLSNDDSSSADWERMLSNLDNGQTTIYDGIYGGPGGQPPSLGDYSSMASSSPKRASPPTIERSTGAELSSGASWSPTNTWSSIPGYSMPRGNMNAPQSVISFTSDENSHMDELDMSFQPSAENAFGKSIVIPGAGMMSPPMMGTSNDMDLFANLDLPFNG